MREHGSDFHQANVSMRCWIANHNPRKYLLPVTTPICHRADPWTVR